VLLAALSGCGTELPASPSNDHSSPTVGAAGAEYEPSRCGRITGQVAWVGEAPKFVPFLYCLAKPDGNFDVRYAENPNAPRVNAENRGVAGAVVHLRGIRPEASKGWDLSPVTVAIQDQQIVVQQGSEEPRRAGFLRRGDTLRMVSKATKPQTLRARGAAYFTLAFPDADQPLSRTLDQTGLVHMTSGSGFYWASAYLYVDNVPYFAYTDRQGRFTIENVPAGPIELVVWQPNGQVISQERDPEACFVTRQTYGEAIEVHRKLVLSAGQTLEVDVKLP
jgi:hypothetical protein